MANPTTKTPADYARCSCGLVGKLHDLRAHLDGLLDADGHVIVHPTPAPRTIDLATAMRRAAIKWASADRAQFLAERRIEAARVCLMAFVERPGVPVMLEREPFLVELDVATAHLRAVNAVCDQYELEWKTAARAFFDEIVPPELERSIEGLAQ